MDLIPFSSRRLQGEEDMRRLRVTLSNKQVSPAALHLWAKVWQLDGYYCYLSPRILAFCG